MEKEACVTAPWSGRNSWIEILRIILMYFIVISHFFIHGSGLGMNNFDIDNAMAIFLSSFGKIAVLTFFMISGFYLSSASFKFSKFLSLIFEFLFYAIFWSIVLIVTKQVSWSLTFLFSIFSSYWFIHVYLVIYLISPFVYKLVCKISGKQQMIFIIILIICCEIISLVSRIGYSEVAFSFISFLFGSWMKKINLRSNKWSRACGLLSYLIGLCLVYLIVYLNLKHSLNISYDPLGTSSPFSLVVSASIFLEFSSLKPFCNKHINCLSSCVFGTYLLSDFRAADSLFWGKLGMVPQHIQMGLAVPYSFILCLIIMVVGFLFDYLRQLAFEHPLLRLSSSGLQKIQMKIDDALADSYVD